MKNFKLSILFFSVFLGGCATTWTDPPIPEFGYRPDTKIAIVNSFAEMPFEIRVGTTAFTNYKKNIDSEMDLKNSASSYLIEQISKTYGYTVEEIPTEAWSDLLGDQPIFSDAMFNSVRTVKEDKKNHLKNIAETTGYSAVIFIGSYKSPDLISNTNQQIDHYGTFSRSFMGSHNHYVHHFVQVTGLSLVPAYNLGSGSKYPISAFGDSSWKTELFTPLVSDCTSENEDIYLSCREEVERVIWGSVKEKIDRFVLRLPKVDIRS